MRNATIALIAVMATLALTGCGGGNSAGTSPTIAPTHADLLVPPVSPTAMRTVTTPGAGDEEVTGIVGVVNVAARTIQIERRSGAAVTKIALDGSTAIRKAAGGTLTLGQIRPSDRIVARGAISERGDELLASEITISQVVPGSSPGG